MLIGSGLRYFVVDFLSFNFIVTNIYESSLRWSTRCFATTSSILLINLLLKMTRLIWCSGKSILEVPCCLMDIFVLLSFEKNSVRQLIVLKVLNGWNFDLLKCLEFSKFRKDILRSCIVLMKLYMNVYHVRYKCKFLTTVIK